MYRAITIIQWNVLTLQQLLNNQIKKIIIEDVDIIICKLA